MVRAARAGDISDGDLASWSNTPHSRARDICVHVIRGHGARSISARRLLITSPLLVLVSRLVGDIGPPITTHSTNSAAMNIDIVMYSGCGY